MMGLDLSAPDHTTLSRRSQHLDLGLRRIHLGEGIHLIVDNSGFSIVGEGEWAAASGRAAGAPASGSTCWNALSRSVPKLGRSKSEMNSANSLAAGTSPPAD
jgi:hypothetical protein